MTIIDDIAEAKKQFSKSDYAVMTKFKLSGKRKVHFIQEDDKVRQVARYKEEDVKEFIRLLKEKIFEAQEDYANLDWIYKESAIKIIDELVGDLK